MSMNQAGHKPSSTSFGTDQVRLVSFNVGKELFAVDILRVQEINRMMSLTQVPQSPPGVCGVINLRGRIVPVLDLRTRFGLEESEHCDESRIIVVEIKGATIGFIVDAVHEVLQINPSIIEEAPAITSSAEARFIKGVAKMKDTLLILLDLDELMTTESLESVGALKKLAA